MLGFASFGSLYFITFTRVEKKKLNRKNNTMEAKEQVLEAMKSAGVPLNAGKIVELTNLDRKVVDKAMTALKNEGAIVSPVRCYWQPK